MATLAKEQHKEKKKAKSKSKSSEHNNEPIRIIQQQDDEIEPNLQSNTNIGWVDETPLIKMEVNEDNTLPVCSPIDTAIENMEIMDLCENTIKINTDSKNVASEISEISNTETVKADITVTENLETNTNEVGNTYCDLNEKLQRIQTPHLDISEHEEEAISSHVEQDVYTETNSEETVAPSAPILNITDINFAQYTIIESTTSATQNSKIPCMPLEEAIRIFGGAEIEEVRAMSEREEAAVELGPVSGPEHPLVDMLSTFRSSLSALERERLSLNCGFIEEEKRRECLWKVEKRSISMSEKCPCGENVELRATYEYAELMADGLPVAKMKLKGLLSDVQDSYCHHQHNALLAHCQIEELVSETIKSNKGEIREALSLILRALRVSDGAGELPLALQRWAAVLTDALVDHRDVRQLLFVVHQLFRQSRSVQWAGRAMRVCVGDSSAAATLIAVLDILLARPGLEQAAECTEEFETWEEVDMKGDGGAVGEGRLRERDLLLLLNCLPLADLVARLALFVRADINNSSEYEWGDNSGGHGVLKACCGARALLSTLARGTRTHPHYERLARALRILARATLHAVAALHLQSQKSYSGDLLDSILSELEACFAAGIPIMGEDLDELPAALLTEDTAKEYCMSLQNLHDKCLPYITTLNMQLPQMSCDVRVRIVTQVSIDRVLDHELAVHVLDFLFRTGIYHKPANLKCRCVEAARAQLARLVGVHPCTHTMLIHMFADVALGMSRYMGEADSVLIQHLCVSKWRPTPGDVRAVLEYWVHKCPQLLQHLLLNMDYTAHSGIPLDSQLFIGWWVYNFSSEAPEWAWAVMMKLQLHLSHWGLPLEAPAMINPPESLIGYMYAILVTDWGHCVPLVCGPGAEALYRLSVSRPVEAAYCLGRMITALASSPESIALTPMLGEAITAILNWSPSLMQRVMGRGESGAELIQRTAVRQLMDIQHVGYRSAVCRAWAAALWARGQGATVALDAAVRAARGWHELRDHVSVLDIKRASDYVLKHAPFAPLLCESVLHAALGAELASGLHGRLLHLLEGQRKSKQRIHVDNALKQSGSTLTSEDMVIHKTAVAALSAPLQHPSHLTLWRLFMHLYLQRPQGDSHESTPPVGPLFFSGLVKARTFAQLKKRLQDGITYHHNEIEKLNREQAVVAPDTSVRPVETSPASDNIFPELSINDMVESFDESDDEFTEEEERRLEKRVEGINVNDDSLLLVYHNGAERLLREYSRWLEEGERSRARPHHADIAQFIPEQALSVAWQVSLPYPKVEPTVTPAQPPPQVHLTYHEMALQAIRTVEHVPPNKLKKYTVKSTVQGVNLRDSRAVLKAIDQRLSEVMDFARDWSSEVGRLSQLDAQLWELVGKLRVRRPLPPVMKACSQNCRPITLRIADEEWCISSGVEQEIKENRRASGAGVRRLCRARPHFARNAAGLLACIRQIRDAETAMHVCERVWQYTPLAHSCSHADQLLNTVFCQVAEKWISCEGGRCAEALTRWSQGDAAQQALCAALISPTKLRLTDWAIVYTTMCKTGLPSNTIFSYLSKFDMSRWSSSVDTGQRQDVLRVILDTVQRLGEEPETTHHMLIELLGVQSTALVTAREIETFLYVSSRCAARCTLPPLYWRYLVIAVSEHVAELTFDQIGHVLRELGAIWREARKNPHPNVRMYAEYAAHMADMLFNLQQAFVAAAIAMSYAPERVTLYAWSSIQESWSPWILPQALRPLLPSTSDNEVYTTMLQKFLDCIHMVMEDCPGSEETMLSEVWRFALETYTHSGSVTSSQEARVQLSALLSALARLHWQHQWYRAACLLPAVQISTYQDREITAWCSATLNHIATDTWLRGVLDQHLAPTLANLFTLFTSKNMQFSQECLSQACALPWWQLPEAALEQVLDQYFVQHHNPAVPYHELPHFCLVISASELTVPVHTPPALAAAPSHRKRCGGVSRWLRACASPQVAPHLRAALTRLLHVLCELAPHVDKADGQLGEILTRAFAILCIEHAAKIVLPVFKDYLPRPALRAAAVLSVPSLTSLDSFVSLADALAAAHLQHDTTGWSGLERAWAASAEWAARACGQRGALHAAYALLRPRNTRVHLLRDTVRALCEGDVNFTENEEILAVWICFACRLAVTQTEEETGRVGEEDEVGRREREAKIACRGAASALISKWSAETKRNLLQIVALRASVPAPTQKQRTLSRFAQSIITPTIASNQSYEAAARSALSLTAAEITRTDIFNLKMLVKLANVLYPGKEAYFKEEAEIADRFV